MGIICAPLFCYAYKIDFLTNLAKSNQRHLAKLFNFRFRYSDDLISFNNNKMDRLPSLEGRKDTFYLTTYSTHFTPTTHRTMSERYYHGATSGSLQI